MPGITGHVSAGGAGGWHCPRRGSRRGPVSARWLRVLPCLGRTSTSELSRVHTGLGTALGVGDTGQRMDHEVLILSFEPLLVFRERWWRRWQPWREVVAVPWCPWMVAGNEGHLHQDGASAPGCQSALKEIYITDPRISHPTGFRLTARGAAPMLPRPRPRGCRSPCAEPRVPQCPHPHSRQQVGSLEPLEPLLQDLRHRLAAALPHVRGHGHAGLPLRGHRRGGEDLQREEVPRYGVPHTPAPLTPHLSGADPPLHPQPTTRCARTSTGCC